jgi:hypothetical protein
MFTVSAVMRVGFRRQETGVSLNATRPSAHGPDGARAEVGGLSAAHMSPAAINVTGQAKQR